MSKLLEVQQALKCPKDQKNNFGGYKYRTCSDILEAVKSLSNEPVILTDEIVLIGDRYYVKATAKFGEVAVTAFAREALTKKGMDEAQITGAASTYARKYALQGLFAIDDSSDDPDHLEPPAPKNIKVAENPSKLKELLQKVQEVGSVEELEEVRSLLKELKKNFSKAEIANLAKVFSKKEDEIKQGVQACI